MSYLLKYRLVSHGRYWYKIPFNEMTSDVSEEVINTLKKGGWVLFRDSMGNYLLRGVDSSKVSWTINMYEGVVYSLCKKYQIQPHLLTPLSVTKYFSNSFLQKIIDVLLQKGYSKEVRFTDMCLGLTMKGDKTFYLVEVPEREVY